MRSLLTNAWELDLFMAATRDGDSELAQAPEFGGAAAWVEGEFGLAGGEGFAGQRIGKFRAQILRRGITGIDGLTALAAKKLFHRPVLEGVETDDRKHSAGRESF